MTEETDLGAMGARLERASERYDKVIGERCEFERGVKLITKEKRFTRAVGWYERFIRSRSADVETAERAIAEDREKGFTSPRIDILRGAFKKWKAEEKSRAARQSGKKGGQGRVRSKNDKRLGARPPG
jgi:hypothetical protein